VGDATVVTVENVLDLPGEVVRDAYRAEVRETDHHVGTLLDFLAEQGLMDDTVVAVVSDHGEYLQEHGLYDHHGLRDEVLRVPMFVRAPGMTAQERRPGTVSTVDLVPTLLDLMGLPPLPGAQGRSLATADPGGERPVFAEWRDYRLLLKRHEAGAGDFQIGVQEGEVKLIRDLLRPEASLLFDQAADPGEDANLFGERVGLRTRLQEMLDRHVREDLPDGLAGVQDIEIDAESMEMLRSLGYVH
jgi:arylsulfatase A-like enzyme